MLTKNETPKKETKTGKSKPEVISSTPTIKKAGSVKDSKACVKVEPTLPATKTTQKTRVTVRADVGFGNELTIRGKGANLSWDKGQPLKNTKSDEWQWETEANFNQCEFKVLLNDKTYEKGDNHFINYGASVIYSPKL